MVAVALLFLLSVASSALAQEPPQSAPQDAVDALTWRRVDQSVERALAFLVTQQLRDGQFQSGNSKSQPGVTALCGMALLAAGHVPGQGPYGEHLNRAIDYVLDSQQSDGLLSRFRYTHSTYSHGIAGIFLAEVYGMTDRERALRIRPAVERALKYSIDLQYQQPKRRVLDRGAWRYIVPGSFGECDSDLSVTCWMMCFLRSAENAGFDVPVKSVDDSAGFVGRCFVPSYGTFIYAPQTPERPNRAMAGAGMLALAMGGRHGLPVAKAAGDWILANNPASYGSTVPGAERYFYAMYHASQGTFQLGGEHWRRFYSQLAEIFLANQNDQGAWVHPPRRSGVIDSDHWSGPAYTTALSILALTPAYQIVPIYQR